MRQYKARSSFYNEKNRRRREAKVSESSIERGGRITTGLPLNRGWFWDRAGIAAGNRASFKMFRPGIFEEFTGRSFVRRFKGLKYSFLGDCAVRCGVYGSFMLGLFIFYLYNAYGLGAVE